MKKCLRVASASLLAAGTAVSAAPYDSTYDQAAGYGVETLENRVEKLEKKFSGQALSRMAIDLEKLQSEVLKLRGQLEKAEHELERLKKQQRDDLAGIDERLRQVTANQSVMQAQLQAAAPAAPATPPAEGTGESSELPVQQPAANPGGSPALEPAAEAAPPPPREVAYQKAFATLKEGRYAEAIHDFKIFLDAYPSGEFSDNAQYWLAEAHYVTKDYGAARIAFEQVIKGFPQSAKIADAMLKIGFIDYERGLYAEARAELAEVVKRYPRSSAAKLAEKRLDKMQQEGR